jgi:hypothetical protein
MTRDDLSRQVQRKNLATLLESSSAFRKFIFTLFTDAGIFYPTYSHRSPYDTAYNTGRQSMGLEVLHMLKHVRPDVLSLIEAEGNILANEIAAVTPDTESEDEDELPTDADDGL